ncbi:prolyl oligopeptidase family serine peptidase [Isosphaeraceae bacterium EP7]
MKVRPTFTTAVLALLLTTATTNAADPKPGETPPLAEYFRVESAKIEAKPLLGIDSADAWKAKRPELKRQLAEMLGLDPGPERVPLDAQVTGTVEAPDFVIEKILFRSAPGLVVTANLYRPKVVDKDKKLPAVLYVCGHGREEIDGLILGNKAHYKHHAAWYAANGYVCLVLDTLELGEVPGLHHGTFRYGMWWWLSRGYSPAGVEAWNGMRGIDYLVSRPEVDATKIGVTGRSGGGATSWWVAAMDDRVAAAIPVAGITDLHNHVVDGMVEEHCDCMYPVNTYRWDFDTLAALVAPRPLLVENTDADPMFPEDGVRRIYAQLQRVYGWYGAADKLGLVVGKGKHVDTEELRHPSFAFMNKWLKGTDAKVEEPPRPIDQKDLRVIAEDSALGPRAANALIQETFIKVPTPPNMPPTRNAWPAQRAQWLEEIRAKVFGGWPAEGELSTPEPQPVIDRTTKGIRMRSYDYESQPGVTLRFWWIEPAGRAAGPRNMAIRVLDEAAWEGEWSRIIAALEGTGPVSDLNTGAWVTGVLPLRLSRDRALVLLAPRGVGPSAWPETKDSNIRRRFYLLGQTLDGMRVLDVRRGIAAMRRVVEVPQGANLALIGEGQAAPLAMWAAVFEPSVSDLVLESPPTSVREGPAFLNLERLMTQAQALTLVHPREVVIRRSTPDAWRWAARQAETLGAPVGSWPSFAPR